MPLIYACIAPHAGDLIPETVADKSIVASTRQTMQQVIFVPFTGGMPSGDTVVVLSGFLLESGDAQGRPVGFALDGTGALLVADDVGNVIWRVSAAP